MTTESSRISTGSAASAAKEERAVSLDQYRGFIVLCLLVVPLLGHLNAAPAIFKHNKNYFSLAGLLEWILE